MKHDDADLRARPRYTTREVARAVGMPPATVSAWLRGYPYSKSRGGGRFQSVIERSDPSDGRLSFNDLLQVGVLRALRTSHQVQLPYIRQALQIAEREHGIEHLLISPELRAVPGTLFITKYGELLELDAAQQFTMESMFQDFLQEFVDFTKAWFFPRERTSNGRKLILVTPFVGFGKPVVKSVGVTTSAIVERFNTGEKREEIITDYGITAQEFDEAVSYETVAA